MREAVVIQVSQFGQDQIAAKLEYGHSTLAISCGDELNAEARSQRCLEDCSLWPVLGLRAYPEAPMLIEFLSLSNVTEQDLHREQLMLAGPCLQKRRLKEGKRLFNLNIEGCTSTCGIRYAPDHVAPCHRVAATNRAPVPALGLHLCDWQRLEAVPCPATGSEGVYICGLTQCPEQVMLHKLIMCPSESGLRPSESLNMLDMRPVMKFCGYLRSSAAVHADWGPAAPEHSAQPI